LNARWGSLCLALSLCELVTNAALPTVADRRVATVDGRELRLDLYLPAGITNPPLVLFIHGGGWRKNSYKNCHTPWLTEHGFAVASIGYRLSNQAVFPAQLHDCKGALRWLRAHADKFGYDATRVGVVGTSAGGHLALMMGVTGGESSMEGKTGGHLDRSSRVAAVVDFYGPSDFLLRSRNQPRKTEPADSPVHLLLGGPAGKMPDLARAASPAFHVTPDDAPLLILHGDKDTTVKPDQSERILAEYRRHRLPVEIEIVHGGRHGGEVYFSDPYRRRVASFLRRHLAPVAP